MGVLIESHEQLLCNYSQTTLEILYYCPWFDSCTLEVHWYVFTCPIAVIWLYDPTLVEVIVEPL